MLYEMRLVGLAMDPFNNSPIVILKDAASLAREAALEAESDDIVDYHAEPSQSPDAGEESFSMDDDYAEVSIERIEGSAVAPSEPEESEPPQEEGEPEDERILPIWIGEAEAHAIATVLLGLSPPRPMTHDLLNKTIEAFGGRVHRVIVTDLRDNTFYARIEVTQEGGEILTLDSRPSDALALALRCDADIFVDSKVLAKTQQSDQMPKVDDEDMEEIDKEQWKELVESLNNDSIKKYQQ